MGILTNDDEDVIRLFSQDLRRDIRVVEDLQALLIKEVPIFATIEDVGDLLSSGWIKVADVVAQDSVNESVGSKVYQDSPDNTVLQTATSSTEDVKFTVRSSYPLVDVGGVQTLLTQSVDFGHYEGTINLSLPAGTAVNTIIIKAVTPDDFAGASDTVVVTVESAPVITGLSFSGVYPTGPGGLQIELKEDDSFDITVTSDKNFDRVDITDFGAAKISSIVVATGTSATVQVIAADRGTSPQALAARVQVRGVNTGVLSATVDTNSGGGTTDGVDLVTLNNLFPSGSVSLITYPATQSALKLVEQATVNHTASDFDSISYTDPTSAQISIANPNTFEATKVVTSLNAGLFNNSSDNFRYLLTRNANGSQAIVADIVVIADVVPTIDITLPAARLRSGGNDSTAVQDHSVTITSDQPLVAAPTLAADGGGNRGTFVGVGFVGGPVVWTRDLRVDETIPDEKGVFSFISLVAVGLAGITQNVINSGSSYTLGGFVQRTLTFASFATQTALNTEVVDFSKLTTGIFTSTNNTALKQSIGTSPSVTDGYTIDAIGVNPTQLVWLDTPAARSNSGGTAQITDVEEIVQ